MYYYKKNYVIRQTVVCKLWLFELWIKQIFNITKSVKVEENVINFFLFSLETNKPIFTVHNVLMTKNHGLQYNIFLDDIQIGQVNSGEYSNRKVYP